MGPSEPCCLATLNGIQRPPTLRVRLHEQGERSEMAHIGIDVSKGKLDCLWLRDPERNKVKTKVFRNHPDTFPALLHWLQENTGEAADQLHVYLEATGIYHEPLAYWLHDVGVWVHVLNPAQVRHHAQGGGVRSKTDRTDSLLLARYGYERSPAPWRPEPPAVRELKRLVERLDTVEADLQREENRLEKAQFNGDAQAEESIHHMLAALRAERDRLHAAIDDHFDHHPHLKQDRALLETIPGIGRVLSSYLVAALRSREFASARQAAAFFGLVPIHEESGTSVRKRTRLSKAGAPKLRQKLYMAAVTATRYNPDIRAQYLRLGKRGKAKMAAIGAAMRKLVHIAYGVLKWQTVYQPRAEQALQGA